MESGQPTKTEKEPESQAGTLDGSIKFQNSDSMPLGASKSSQPSTTATTLIGSQKTWKSAELAALLSKAGLVAGALADFQSAGGMVLMDEMSYTKASGSKNKAIKLLLFVRDADLVAERTADGIDFRLMAEAVE